MSDFLATVGVSGDPSGLVAVLQQPYRPELRQGVIRGRGWAACGLLKEAANSPKNFLEDQDVFVGWVGDLPDAEALAREFADIIHERESAGARLTARDLAGSRTIQRLSGSFAMLLLGRRHLAVISDPMAGVPIYLTPSGADRGEYVGTHPDLVAAISGYGEMPAPVSIGDYLDQGTPCCPHTMYPGVFEIEPGQVVVWNAPGERTKAAWWSPPAEEVSIRIEDAAEEFARLWRQSIERRCTGKRVAVQLSGGMDSRAVMAVVPRDIECTGLTFGDTINREARVSARVAASYGRTWKFLPRDTEYLGRTAGYATRFTGCEGEWHHAHAIGLLPQFQEGQYDAVFTGLFMDNNFKGYYAEDIVPVRRHWGLAPPAFRVRRKDFVEAITPWCREHLRPEIHEARIARRRAFYETHWARGRQSEWEWLDGHPVSQASDNTGWFVERRLLPLRLPVYDRPLVDLALRIPALAKAGGAFFQRALVQFLGAGNKIQNANDGARPGSAPAVQQAQRVVRKVQRSIRERLGHLGWRAPVPHSWHDYPGYWRKSPVIRSLLDQHQHLLEIADPAVPTDLLLKALDASNLPWRFHFRLLQLVLWVDWIRDLQRSLPAIDRPRSPVVSTESVRNAERTG